MFLFLQLINCRFPSQRWSTVRPVSCGPLAPICHAVLASSHTGSLYPVLRSLSWILYAAPGARTGCYNLYSFLLRRQKTVIICILTVASGFSASRQYSSYKLNIIDYSSSIEHWVYSQSVFFGSLPDTWTVLIGPVAGCTPEKRSSSVSWNTTVF